MSALTIKNGKTRSFLETKKFVQNIRVALPVLTVKGVKTGPLVMVMSSQHGREINGIAVIERVFAQLNPAKLKGTVVFLPVMNPLGIYSRRQDYPCEEVRYRKIGIKEDIYNINRQWGKKSKVESYAAAIPEIVWEKIGKYADYSCDMHGWSGNSLSLAWAHRKHLKFLRSLGFPYYMIWEPKEKKLEGLNDKGMWDYMAWTHNIVNVTVELSPQNVVLPATVKLGEQLLLNLLKVAGVIEGEPTMAPIQYEFEPDHKEIAITAEAEGLLVSDLTKGSWVEKGDNILKIISLKDLGTLQEYKAEQSALLYNIGGAFPEDSQESSIVYPGQLLGLLKVPSKIVKN